MSAIPVWKGTAIDKNGKAVEFAPTMKSVTFRGPRDLREAKQALEIMLLNMNSARNSRDAEADDGEDTTILPCREMHVEVIGQSDDKIKVGDWRPKGGVPMQVAPDPGDTAEPIPEEHGSGSVAAAPAAALAGGLNPTPNSEGGEPPAMSNVVNPSAPGPTGAPGVTAEAVK